MKRCIETANLLYPQQSYLIIDDFRECNFGDFENKNYLELQDNKDYQAWIDSNGEMPFPNGESLKEFKTRCVNAFSKLIKDLEKTDSNTIALVVHGGTIMAIMSEFCDTKKSYYDWMIENAEGYICELDGDQLVLINSTVTEKKNKLYL